MLKLVTLLLTLFAVAASAAPPTARGEAYTLDPVSTTYRPLTGRLFFSDAERARLDKARKDGVQILDGEVVARSPQLNGFVKSSDGRTTFWVDGAQRVQHSAAKLPMVASSMTGGEPTVKLRSTSAAAPTEATAAKSPRAASVGTKPKVAPAPSADAKR